MNKEEFIKQLGIIGISLSDEQLKKLDYFADLLIEYNKHTNITSIIDKESIFLKHFYDSLSLVKIIDLNSIERLLDVGSGGGFPGIVLKIAFPRLKITLLDSNHKKTDFQNYIIEKLELSDILTINDRAENYVKTDNKYDLVVARAVSSLNILSELCIPFVNVGGYFVAMKGEIDKELEECNNIFSLLGTKIEKNISFKLPVEGSTRNLLLVYKEKNTPSKYPREYKVILKKPLK